jgi:hypothetical protein
MMSVERDVKKKLANISQLKMITRERGIKKANLNSKLNLMTRVKKLA